MDSDQFWGFTDADIYRESYSLQNPAYTEWTFDSIKSALGNSLSSPTSSRFEFFPLLSNSQEQNSFTETISG